MAEPRDVLPSNLRGHVLCQRAALLISGQDHRFTYRDALLPGDRFPCEIDVYVVLSVSNGDTVHWTDKAPVRPAYHPAAPTPAIHAILTG